MSGIITYKNGKPTVKVAECFTHVFKSVPSQGWDYDDALNTIVNTVLAADKKIKTGALSNTRGQWFEWMVSIDSYNRWLTSDDNFLILNLPNVSRFDSASLYTKEIYGFVQDLRNKLDNVLDINLITSNPDFVIIDTTNLRNKFSLPKITKIDSSTIEAIDCLYRQIIHSCELDDVVGYLSLKTSLRPDRRLQIAHEGSLTKAIYVHLQTRGWIMEPRGIKYFGASLSMSQADIKGLKTVATHSITTVMSKPEKAVDELFQIRSRDDLYLALDKMIFTINK